MYDLNEQQFWDAARSSSIRSNDCDVKEVVKTLLFPVEDKIHLEHQ